MRKEKRDRIILAAPGSGSGKTLVTCALLRLLQRQGHVPQSFKCGPDYIDPMFHKTVLGISSRNLDLFLAEDAKQTIASHTKAGSISVIEGVMGYFDGMGADSMRGSTYDVACRSGSPVILVVPAGGMSRSIVAQVKGFVDYEQERHIAGIILNRISMSIYPAIKARIEEELQVPVIGAIEKLPDLKWESRHLGLVMPDEIKDILKQIDRAADNLALHLDMDRLLEIASSAEALEIEDEVCEQPGNGQVTVAVARDEAFCFYYEDNLELLEKLGVRLVTFSPLADERLPEADGLLLGGGYPELHAKKLSANETLRRQIAEQAAQGMPMLAECGGFMYLQETLIDQEGQAYPMVGALEGSCRMSDRLVHFGYSILRPKETEALYLQAGHRIRAHEFHYYQSTQNGDACIAQKPIGTRSWEGMVCKGNVMAGFSHLYYPSDPDFVQAFIDRCREYRYGRRDSSSNSAAG